MNNKVFMLSLALTMLSAAALRAQVTIGENLNPATFSILELISNQRQGLRLPQMTTAERDALVATQAFQDAVETEALGLQIFNTSNKCIETWNGKRWISQCTPPSLDAGGGGGATVTAAISAYVNVMYDFQYQKITAYSTSNTLLRFQWFVKQRGQADSEYKAIEGATTATYNIPVNFVKNIFRPLCGGNTSDYNEGAVFKCAVADDNGFGVTNEQDIEFIGTNTDGYVTYYGMRGLSLNSGSNYYEGFYDDNYYHSSINTIAVVALTNLGQSSDFTMITTEYSFEWSNMTYNNNAADLGDFYQWGRQADGHEKTVWSKDAAYGNAITPMTGMIYTSAPVDYKGGTALHPTYSYNNNLYYESVFGNVVVDADNYYADYTYGGKFIYSTGSGAANGDNDWHYDATNATYPGHFTDDWTSDGGECTNRNNRIPCPRGWSIPSAKGIGNLVNYDYNNASAPYGFTGNWTTAPVTTFSGNTWQWRPSNGAGNCAIGGAIITNSNGEKLFIPATGARESTSGNLTGRGTDGFFWSINRADTDNSAKNMHFNSNSNSGGNSNSYRAFGLPIRCVAHNISWYCG